MSESLIVDYLTWDTCIKELPLNYEGHAIKVEDNYYKSVGGNWVLQIIWTNCADKLPSGSRCIIKLTHNNEIYVIRPEWFVGIPYMWHWTPYTKEKWEELDNGR
jgi:hypothetical protein